MSLDAKTKQALSKLYTDPESGFGSKTAFVKGAKEAGISATQKQIGEWFDSQGVNQIFRAPPIKRADYAKIQCRWGRGCFQADLMDVSKYSGSNKGVTFLLNVIEVPTKYVWSFPLKNKTPTLVAKHLRTVWNDFHAVKPKHVIDLRTDDGNEFKGAVNTLNKELGVMHQTTVNKRSMGMVESLHKVFWNFFRRWSAVNDNRSDFITQLPKFVTNYNNRKHTTTKEKPTDLFHERKETPLLKPQPANKMKAGDLVRIRREKQIFDKASFLPSASDQVYVLVSYKGRRWVLKNNKSGHELEDLYLERELIPVKEVSTEVLVEKAIKERNKVARTVRKNKQETAFQLTKGEKRRLKPVKKTRAVKTPARFRGDGIVFYD